MTDKILPLILLQMSLASNLLLKPNISFNGWKDTGKVGRHFEKYQKRMVLQVVKAIPWVAKPQYA